MSLKANQGGKGKKIDPNDRVPDGAYPARIVQVIDLGVQHTEVQASPGNFVPGYWKNKEKVAEDTGEPVYQPYVFIQFEFPTSRIDIDGESKPRWVGKEYLISNHEKSGMYALMEAAGLDPVNGYVGELIGETVQVTIRSTSGGKAKIKAVSPLMDGIEVPPLENDPKMFDLDNWDQDLYDSLPKFLKAKIDGRIIPGTSGEDIPF